MKAILLDKIVPLLLVLGGLNIGLAHVFDFNPIEKVLGSGTTLTGIVYILVGVSALFGLYHLLDETMHPKATS